MSYLTKSPFIMSDLTYPLDLLAFACCLGLKTCFGLKSPGSIYVSRVLISEFVNLWKTMSERSRKIWSKVERSEGAVNQFFQRARRYVPSNTSLCCGNSIKPACPPQKLWLSKRKSLHFIWHNAKTLTETQQQSYACSEENMRILGSCQGVAMQWLSCVLGVC